MQVLSPAISLLLIKVSFPNFNYWHVILSPFLLSKVLFCFLFQLEYQEEMKANYREMTKELSEIMHEQVGATLECFSFLGSTHQLGSQVPPMMA